MRMLNLHIPTNWYLNLMKTLGGVREFTQNRSKNEYDLGDLDLWPMTLKPLDNVFLDRTYLPCKYDQPTPSLRVPYLPSKIWPLTPFIWPLGQKFKIPASYVFAYAHFAHSYQTISKSDEYPRRSSRKYEKLVNFEHLFDPCDLDLGRTILNFPPGWCPTQDPYTMRISRRSNNGKWVKRVSRTDGHHI